MTVAKVLACGSGLTIQHVKAGRTKVNFPIIIGHEITAEMQQLLKLELYAMVIM